MVHLNWCQNDLSTIEKHLIIMVIVVHDFDIYTALSDDRYCVAMRVLLSCQALIFDTHVRNNAYITSHFIHDEVAFGFLFLAGSVYLTKAVLGKISFVPEVSK